MFHFSKVILNLRNDRDTFLSVSCFLPYCKQVGFLCRYDGCILRPCASFSFHRLKFFHCFYYNFTLTNLLVRQIKAGKICRIVPSFYNLKPLMSTVFARNYKIGLIARLFLGNAITSWIDSSWRMSIIRRSSPGAIPP